MDRKVEAQSASAGSAPVHEAVDEASVPTPTPIAIISNSLPPYRLHLHRRIIRELPQVQLWSLFTHEVGSAAWKLDFPSDINPVQFGAGQSVAEQGRVSNALREWRRGGKIIRWLRDHHIRFVVVMGYNDAGRVRIIRWCGRKGIPCFVFGDSNIRGDTATGAKALLKRLIVSRVLSWCSGALACGSLGRAYFRKYGVPDDRIFYFPYEPDYQEIEQVSPAAVEAARKRHGLVAERQRIIYSGRLVEQKRVDLLIDAFARIAPERPNWDLVIAGDGPLLQQLQARVPGELRHRLVWAGFIAEQEKLSALYHACQVLVLPSDYEPWALVINEAAAAGLAIIATDVVGAAAELVRDADNGRIVPPGDIPALTSALLDVTSGQRWRSMGAASRAAVARWQKEGDPVAGLVGAMTNAGTLIGPITQAEGGGRLNEVLPGGVEVTTPLTEDV